MRLFGDFEMQKLLPLEQVGRFRRSISLFFLAIFIPAIFAQGADETTQLVLANATLIDGTGAPGRSNVTVVIEDGLISEIVDSKEHTGPPNAEIIDLSGRFLLPGFIDAHVHVSNEPDKQAALRKFFEEGVTTVRDMGGDARTLAVLARDVRIGAFLSPDIYYSAVLFGPSFLQDPRSRRSAPDVEPGTAPWSRVVTTDSDLAQMVAEAKGTGATALKLYAAMEPNLVRGIVSEAHRQGLKVWSHATIFPSKPSDAVTSGVDVISHSSQLYAEARPDVPSSYTKGITEWMPQQDFAAVDPSAPPFNDLFALMKRQGSMLEPTIAIFRQEQHRRGVPETGNRQEKEGARRIDIAALADWACAATRSAHEAGVVIVAGTDSTPGRSISISDEMEALVDCGLSPLEAIRAATLNGARAIGIDATHGSVEVGKVADLVVLAADPTENIARVIEVVATVKSGRLHDREGPKE
jgi:imidazolonepropionase-like amidohydrolase